MTSFFILDLLKNKTTQYNCVVLSPSFYKWLCTNTYEGRTASFKPLPDLNFGTVVALI